MHVTHTLQSHLSSHSECTHCCLVQSTTRVPAKQEWHTWVHKGYYPFTVPTFHYNYIDINVRPCTAGNKEFTYLRSAPANAHTGTESSQTMACVL